MSLSRRSVLKYGVGVSAALLLDRMQMFAETIQQQTIVKKPIPRTGEMLPVIGLGGLQLNVQPTRADFEVTKEVIKVFYDLGGRVLDSAPGYTASESLTGDTLQELGRINDYFIATKFNAQQLLAGSQIGTQIHPSQGEVPDKAEMERQFRQSLLRFHRQKLDLEQIWNLGDTQPHAEVSSESAGMLPWHLDKAKEWKAAGLTRYIGITTSRDPQYAELLAEIPKKDVDFIQLDLSITDTIPEDRLLPACIDAGAAVLVNRPFGVPNLIGQAAQKGKVLPPWAAELGITAWSQYFLKYIVSHPAVTAAIPSTNDLTHLHENMMACVGPMPDMATRKKMRDYWLAA